MATVREIARLANVSISTVSYVLNNSPNVSGETRQKVLRIAQELDYNIQPQRRGDKIKKKEGVIGLFVSNFNGSYSLNLVEEMFLCAYFDHMRSLHVHIEPKISSREFSSQLLSSGVQSAIILHNTLPDECVYKLKDCGIPMVFLDREIVDNKISFVLVDNYNGMCQQVEYLIKTGHKRIGYMKGNDRYDDRKRYLAYIDTMKKHSMPIDESLIWSGCYNYLDAKYSLINAYPEMKSVPDAICCSNDDMALGCIDGLEESGFSVPRDISVCGFDDLYLSSTYKIPLTTVINPVRTIAKTAVGEAVRLLSPEAKGQAQFIRAEFVVRKSSAVRNGSR